MAKYLETVYLLIVLFCAANLQTEGRGVSQVGFSIYKDKENQQAKEGNGNNKVIVTYAINHPTNQGDTGDVSLKPAVLPQFSRHDQHQLQISSYVAQQQQINPTRGGAIPQASFQPIQPSRIQQRLPTIQRQPQAPLPNSYYYAAPAHEQIPQQRPVYGNAVPQAQPNQFPTFANPPPLQTLSSSKYQESQPQTVPSYSGYTMNQQRPEIMATPSVSFYSRPAPSTQLSSGNTRNIIGLEQRLKIANARKSFLPVYSQDLQLDGSTDGQNPPPAYNEALDTNFPLEFF